MELTTVVNLLNILLAKLLYESALSSSHSQVLILFEQKKPCVHVGEIDPYVCISVFLTGDLSFCLYFYLSNCLYAYLSICIYNQRLLLQRIHAYNKKNGLVI
jgi:hypothetical protein